MEDVKVREMQIFDYKKKIAENETKLKQQQNLYEAVRSDRNLYSKNLIESQDEITEMKRKLKIMNHQIDQLKEEISSKEAMLVKEHLEHQRWASFLFYFLKIIGEDVKIPTYQRHTNHKRSSVRSHTLAQTSICDLSHSLCWSPLTDLGHKSSVAYVCHPLWFVCGHRKGILTSPLDRPLRHLSDSFMWCRK